MSNVQSRPLADGKVVERPQRGFRWDRLPLTLSGWLLLGLWWGAGAKYTIDGLPLAINVVLDFFHVPAGLDPITDWHAYLYLCWIPVVISLVERRNRPWHNFAFSAILIYAAVIWLAVSALDMGSTWLAVTHPQPGAWPIAHQLAALKPLAFAWTLATTFSPEVGIAVLWRYLVR